MIKTAPSSHQLGNTNASWVLRAENIHVQFGGKAILRGIDLDIRPGTVTLLRGSNGVGKTCLIDVLCGILEPTAGRIQLRNGGNPKAIQYPKPFWHKVLQLTNAHPERFGRWGTARTWQDARLFEGLNLRDNVRIADRDVDGEHIWSILARPRRVQLQNRRAQKRAQMLLTEFGLGDRADSMADAVSLGQAKRIGILRAMVAHPQILFLDEPLSSLDGYGVKKVLSLLHRLRTDHNVALVVVEHAFNVPHILDIASEVWTLDEGRLQIQTPKAVHAELGIRRPNCVPEWLVTVAGPDSAVERKELPNGAVLFVATPARAGACEAEFSVDDLVIYRGSRLVVGKDTGPQQSSLSFALRRGQIAVLMAPNGWGKSTVVAAAAGLLPIASGDVRLGGRSIAGQPTWQRANAGMAVLQSADHSFSDLTTREALRLAGVETPSASLERLLGSRVGNLSSGERQLLSLECALRSGRFTVGLLDEPFQSLDHGAVQSLCMRLADLLPDHALLITMPRAAGTGENLPVAHQESES